MPSEHKTNETIKYKLATAMKECMKSASVEKITVTEIVETCGVTRQTFYRNFKDKYDLINWYFDKILLESFEHMGEGKTVYEGLVNKFLDCQHFFRQIFLGYFPDIVQAFDTLGRNVYGDDYTSLHNPIVLSSVLLVYGMFHSTRILF